MIINDQIIALFNKYYEFVYTTDDSLSRGDWKRLFAQEIVKLFAIPDVSVSLPFVISYLRDEENDYINIRDGWKEHTEQWEVYDLVVRQIRKQIAFIEAKGNER